MESTKLLNAIMKLREQYATPPSHMEVVRDSVLKQLATINKVEMPAILDETQRKVFVDKIDMLAGFLESDDGADAVELLVNAFEAYCDNLEAQPVADEPAV